ncbi:hypothetical protein BpHYR1_016322 [Brachionus plicatilis]|uniref:C-type lectin domain-containing protein n=1 Tax=Brachionus plicatilis TaxID=10195 RepID=A0A3M7SU53_BRAPC|nr:hypothetical protein BpHYR1_016322 [Brachionus plicatilis]
MATRRFLLESKLASEIATGLIFEISLFELLVFFIISFKTYVLSDFSRVFSNDSLALCLMMHNSKSFFIRKSVFKKAENLSVFTNLIISKTVRNNFFCLDECNSNNRCTYLKFSNKLCHLYEGFGNNQTGLLLKLYLAKVPQMNLQINCRNSSVYWSLETSNCLLCPNNFIKYDENPYACYHNSFQQLNFTDGKNYCGLKNSFLPSPKTIKEINILLNICGNDYSQIWLDSSISSINETYRWRDGSLVENFEDGEPNNRDGNEINLVETQQTIKNQTCAKYFLNPLINVNKIY